MSTKEANGFFTTADSLRMQGAALIREDEKMKTWTMPKINVEGFSADEYIAACSQLHPISERHDYWYVDLNGDGKYLSDPAAQIETFGSNYTTGNNHDFTAQNSYITSLDGFTKLNPSHDNSGWLRGRAIYYADGSVNPEHNTPYSSDPFRYFGVYDIYFNSKFQASLYTAGSAGNFDPTTSLNMS